MKDYLLKAVACHEHVRVYICSSTNLVEEARQRLLVTHEAHQPSAVAKTFLEYCRLRLELKTEKHIDSI